MSDAVTDWDALWALPVSLLPGAAAREMTRLCGEAFSPTRHGDLPRWQRAVEALPLIVADDVQLSEAVVIAGRQAPSHAQSRALHEALMQLRPWRKGPLRFFDLSIDAEWRSDWKWARLRQHIAPLAGRRVLDVGCGNGYYGLRMLGQGAGFVLGLDPSLLFVCQFAAVHRYAPGLAMRVLPLGIEALPPATHAFDTVFSMGVLYHRRDPLEHLRTLRDALRSGGELVLETLVLDGERDDLLVPEGRYAQMRNVWALPSTARLLSWLAQCGWQEARVIDVTRTLTSEQRTTPWMPFRSLADFLDPHNPDLTVEGHPAPRRAVVIATAPDRG